MNIYSTLLICQTLVFTVQRYASALYAAVVCLCLSHAGIVSKRPNIGSRKQSHDNTWTLVF